MLTHDHIRAYQRRLTDLSQRNRALKHLRLSARRDFDLESFSYLEGKSVDELLWSALRGHKTTLIKQVSERAEQSNILDARLRKIHRTLQLTEAETGLYDFFLGYPFIEGKFADGSICRSPLMLLPMQLVRKDSRPRWSLHPREGQQSIWNPIFLRAYERYTATRIPEGLWSANPIADSEDLQSLLNRLYTLIRDFDLRLDFQSETHRQHVKPYRELLSATAEQFQQGVLKLQPYAVLGVFPQSDATLLQDYETLLTQNTLPTLNTTSLKAINLDQLPEDEFICLPTDESQLYAHRALRTGSSITVQGPPGTGKSQWIVNVVADYLMRNKRVLVVSQKRAALEVVYERLTQLNFEPFTYLIHDFRNDRAAVYNKLSRFLESLPEMEHRQLGYDQERSIAEYQNLTDQINTQLSEFNTYSSDVARPRPWGLNVLELYERIDPEASNFDIDFDIKNLLSTDLPELQVRLQELWAYEKVFCLTHPWAERQRLGGFSNQERQQWLRMVDVLPETCAQLHQAQALLTTSDGRFLPEDVHFKQDLAQLFGLLQSLIEQPELTEALGKWLMDPRPTQETKRLVSEFQQLILHIETAEYIALKDVNEADRLLEAITKYKAKKGQLTARTDATFRHARRDLKTFAKQKQLTLKTLKLDQLQLELGHLSELRHLLRTESIPLIFNDLYLFDSVKAIRDYLLNASTAIQIYNQLQLYSGWTLPPLKIRTNSSVVDTVKELKAAGLFLQSKASLWQLKTKQLRHYFGTSIKKNILSEVHDPIAIVAYAERLQVASKQDYEQMVLADSLLETLTEEATKIFESHLQPRLPLSFKEAWANTGQAIYRNWLKQAQADSPSLIQPQNPHYQQRISLLQTRWQRHQALAQELVLHTLQTQAIGRQSYNRLSNPVTYREIRHQVNKRRLIWPIRQLIEQAWDSGLDHLMPCVLASPETVSAIFPMQTGLFDLVVFDEASQCAVERALPAMLRGKQTAVVGDHQQLQPLQLFQAETSETLSTDLQSTVWEESESVLDLARQRFPERMLQWHYRSRVPELIAFSNQHFYHDSLRSLPSAHPSTELQAFDYHHLSGRWQNGVNQLEAHEIVARTLGLLLQTPHYSVGIVTFNQQQQDLILELLESKLPELHESGKGELADFLTRSLNNSNAKSSGDELLLVRNIENVQGNERDIILFSIGYGPTAGGKLSTNFGLLNRVHGENRLNVAITRARRRVEVFASFKPWELKVEDAKNEGPKLLKRWLQMVYDATEDQQIIHHGTLPSPSIGFTKIKALLEPYGLKISEIPFDTSASLLGIYKPSEPESFLAGLIVESTNWYDTPSALARLVFQPQQLAGRDWQIHYLWARALWQQPERTIQKLIEQLDL